MSDPTIRFECFSELKTWYRIFLGDQEIGMAKKKRFGKDFYWVAEDSKYFFCITGAKTRGAAVRALLVLMGLA